MPNRNNIIKHIFNEAQKASEQAWKSAMICLDSLIKIEPCDIESMIEQRLNDAQKHASKLAAAAMSAVNADARIKKEKPLRRLEIGQHRFTEVRVMDEPGAGGACHEYHIAEIVPNDCIPHKLGDIKFQKGPVQESGVNGCFQEDLIAIVIDRLQCFQAGDFACRENEKALTKLEEALHWLNHRTNDRQARGVEGKSEL